MALSCVCWHALANPVDLTTAREVAFRFMNASMATQLRSTDDVRHVATFDAGNAAALYVFANASDFVIVAADDCARPILGYGNNGSLDVTTMPAAMQSYLQNYAEQIGYARMQGLTADAITTAQWTSVMTTGVLRSEKDDSVVEPLLTSRWNQNRYYNRFCPDAPGGPNNHAYAGCVATAMAQVMRYWGWPETGNGSHSYTPSGFPTQTVNFGTTTYQWAQMLDELKNDPDISEIRPIATLIWHCGVSVDMMYGAAGSGADMGDAPYALVNYFRYDEGMEHVFKNDDEEVFYTDEEWFNMIKNCLDQGRPLLYGGVDEALSFAHAFVCDGYDANGLLHFNWGWSGEWNDYYAIGALDPKTYHFSRFNSAIFNIRPLDDAVTEGQSRALSVYPNPAHDRLTLAGPSIQSVHVYNVMGQLVLTRQCDSVETFELDLSALPAGVYSVSVHSADGAVVNTSFVKK